MDCKRKIVMIRIPCYHLLADQSFVYLDLPPPPTCTHLSGPAYSQICSNSFQSIRACINDHSYSSR